MGLLKKYLLTEIVFVGFAGGIWGWKEGGLLGLILVCLLCMGVKAFLNIGILLALEEIEAHEARQEELMWEIQSLKKLLDKKDKKCKKCGKSVEQERLSCPHCGSSEFE